MRVALASILALPVLVLCVIFVAFSLRGRLGVERWEDLTLGVWVGLVLSVPVVALIFLLAAGIR